MERRYKVFHDCGKAVVDINGYNEFVASETVQKMARIVIVIDELADLMQFCKRDLEKKISALAAKARSAGIHLVLATQRPSVDVITGVIKANLPSRVAFKVMGQPDSMTILGESGAEKLLGNGDMLYKNSGMPNYERYQGAFITAKETNEIVDFIIKNNKAYFNDDLAKYLENAVNPPVPEKSMSNGTGIGSEADDSLFVQALAYVIEVGGASISSLQRRFRIGFSKAGNYIDRMAELGYISGNEGSKARRVLISSPCFLSILPDRSAPRRRHCRPRTAAWPSADARAPSFCAGVLPADPAAAARTLRRRPAAHRVRRSAHGHR